MTRRKDAPPKDAPSSGRDPDEAAARKAKGSVHEAIGKLIGDDAAARQGAAEQKAATKKPPRA